MSIESMESDENEARIVEAYEAKLREKDAVIDTMNEAHKILMAEKDAEIARLKADVEYWHHIATVEKNALITELCDALEGVGPYDAIANMKLIQGAREATR